jgi:heavy metal translocating P-type ATPase
MNLRRTTNLLLLAVSAGGLITGIAARLSGEPKWAEWIWVFGSAPVLLAVLVGIGRAVLRREAGLDLIALLSMAGAMALGEYLTGAVIGLMLASGRSLEDFAEARARREMSALLSRAPRTANRYEGANNLLQIQLDMIRPGDRLLVRTGEAVPTDGAVSGATAVLDESALTGEALPVQRASGVVVRSGAVNAATPFDMIATTAAADSTFAGIVRLVEAAQRAKAPSARLADRYALLFVPLSLAVAGVAWIATADPVRALAVLVVATPCPLILAVPVAIVAGMSRCAKRGVLIKGGGMLEKLAQAKTLFFDKTGTLTGGRARLVATEAAPELGAAELLRIAASLDQVSQHVIAQAIVTAARDRGLALSMPSSVEEQPGAGLTGIVDNRRVAVGSYAFVCASAAPADWSHRFLRRMGYDGATGVFVAIDGVMAGALLLLDEIRAETPRALRLLRKAGVERIVMVTGDRRDVAETVGALLGVDEVLAEQKPEDKLAAIKASRSAGSTIMVGDGVNDAPALAAADVGVAMGARGTAASSEAAGVVLLVDRLDRLAEALRISHRARTIAVESVVAGMGLSIVAMGAAALGYLPPLVGAVLQEAIDVAVILNALRALHVHGPREGREALTQVQLGALKQEHDELSPILERVRFTADRLAIVPGHEVAAELFALNELLREQLLPHERQDDAQVYPAVARLIGGDDPLATMSRMHREIYHLARLLSRMAQDLPPEGPDPEALVELQRVLYGLDAILKLHFAQEEELYHVLADAA